MILEQTDTLCFIGTVSLTILHGHAQILGTELSASSRPHPVFAPRSSPLPVLSCSRATSASEYDGSAIPGLTSDGTAHLTPQNCAVLLQPLRTGVEGLSDVCGVFEGVFRGIDDYVEVLFDIDGFFPVSITGSGK